MRETCPHCGQPLPKAGRPLTERELDVLASWWIAGSVKEAAVVAGCGQQRAKNILSRARIRSGVSTNEELLALHFTAARSRATQLMSHNIRRESVA